MRRPARVGAAAGVALLALAALARPGPGLPPEEEPEVGPPAGEASTDGLPGLRPPAFYLTGERLTYSVAWLGIQAGEATLEARGLGLEEGAYVYRFVTTARTRPPVSAIFRVEDRSESWVDAAGFHSRRFSKHLREGGYRHNSVTTFDLGSRSAIYDSIDFGRVPREVTALQEVLRVTGFRRETFALPGPVQDELSGLYAVRALPLEVGRAVILPTFANKKLWDLEVRVLGREALETVLGPVETLVVEPRLKFEGLFQRKGRVLIWLTDDEDRVPVRMESEVRVGAFVATLVRRELPEAAGGLRFRLEPAEDGEVP
jgi:hypothetical protein